MKKTISINISGFNFHIDEDAYEKLHRYLEAIKSHFRGIEGSDEVMSDIEFRVSEILQSRLSDSKQVITLEDVDEVIKIMGQPSDFAPGEEEGESFSGSTYVHYQKRLYRDPEHKMLGGVCSGIGAYFNLDPVWVRIIFLLLLFASGFGVLLYIILWLVVPEARTTAEKLEMRGQPVTVSTLEQSIRQGVGEIKDKVHEMTDKARETFRNQDRSYVRDNFRSVGRFFLRIVAIFTGIVLFLMAASLSLAFAFVIFRFPDFTFIDHGHFGAFPLFPFLSTLFDTDGDLRTFSIGIIILIGIPLLLLMLAGLRLVFRIPSFRYINGAAGWIWLITLLLTAYFGLKIAGSFRFEGESNKEHMLTIGHGDTLRIVSLQSIPLGYYLDYRDPFSYHDWGLYLTDSGNAIYGIPRLRITESPDSIIHLNENYYSRGSSRAEAIDNAEAIEYPWSMDSNTLSLPESFRLGAGEKWKKQELMLDLKLPKGTIFRTEDNIPRMLTGTWGMSRRELTSHILMMTENGVHQYVP